MTENNKNLNEKVEQLEAAVKKYASKDTVLSVGGYEFTPSKLMVAFTIVSSIMGSLYGAFEVYKDYQSMKKKISEYSAPDLSDFDKRLAIIEENSQKGADYTRDIKNDLKTDIRRAESVAEQIERSVKQAQRETDTDLKSMQKDLRANLDRTRDDMDKLKRETDNRLDRLNRDIDQKIKQAIDNPLSNK